MHGTLACVRPCEAALGVLVAAMAVPSFGQEAPFGRWLTENRKAVISIELCEGSLCGRIVGLVLDHIGDPIPVDHEGRSQCGLTIITGAVPEGAGWLVHIIDPRDGSVYRARLNRNGPRQLRVRGYIVIPLFGQTQVWTLFSRPIPDDCRLSPLSLK